MQFLDLTLATAEENLALDEALLDEAEAAPHPVETLRLWEPTAPMVVVGRSSRLADEVDLKACEVRGIPVLRRTSGGAAIVTGPGCLMYAVVLSYQKRPELRAVDHAHRLVMETLARAIQPLTVTVANRGICDLTLDDRKFSGNSLRMKRECLLYHGTVLHDFSLDLIETCLTMPPRMPDYRQTREHGDFVTNLNADIQAIRASLVDAWEADTRANDWPRARTAELVRTRYGCDAWNRGR